MKTEKANESPDREAGVRSHAIAADLRAGILDGLFTPGTRVRQEELAERYGTSRIPVREALRDLESEGLVVLVPNSGAWIAKTDINECVEIYQIRERIEPLALSESIRRMDDATIARLAELCAQIEASTEVEDFLKLDREFHLLSYKAAAMPTLLAMIERFWNTTQHYRRAYSHLIGKDGQWIIHAEHRLIMEAIRRRDPVDVQHLLESHIRRTRLHLQANDLAALSGPRR
ncbi:GntR family transcriptional regulator [Xanthobacter dioxanivorans]|uniref:GntR family transcriptional regulator n=1 Tax=Xanthobacter dioxanivorans TaxID=2528964 RepID=A0A974PM97_9HYPH|nr:GntR family transcriptional regulator [Xanthobacter dioxanivorans]QRG06208.1 GntR family transcriptional regulator [Xanthobacter dioxanivorans]